MKFIVCGGRDFADEQHVWDALESFHRSGDGPITTLIHGGATGADQLAAQWGKTEDDCRVIECKADWKRHGKAAGPIRNQMMLDVHQPDGVIAFKGGKGTRDMIRRAENQFVKVFRL